MHSRYVPDINVGNIRLNITLFLRIITLLRNLKFKFNSFYNFSLSKF
mgnify:CR=1 FL=1